MRAAGGRSTGTAGSARGYDTLKRIEDARRRRDDRTAGGDAGRARIRMYAASRLLDEEEAGRCVPGMHVRLDEGVEASRRHVGEHQRAGAHVLDRGTGFVQAALDGEVLFEAVTRDVAGAHERMIDPVARRDVQPYLVAPGAFAFHRPEQLVERRVVDDAQPALATDDESDRDAPVAHAVHEIDRAVDRVDHPQVTPDLPAALLGEQRFAGKL